MVTGSQKEAEPIKPAYTSSDMATGVRAVTKPMTRKAMIDKAVDDAS